MRTLVLKNAEIYAPEVLGKQDLLIAGEQISLIAENIDGGFANTEVVDCAGKFLVPGFLDCHVHLTGGGGEAGYASRVPEARVEELAEAGVTTVLGLLGTDSVSRSLENLYAKACALEEEGLSSYMLTGAYRYPSPTLTGEVMKDLALIDKVIGVKIALSDHRGSALSAEELARLCADTRVGGLISGKAGLIVIHMGGSERGFAPIRELLEYSDLPIRNLLPTHCGRSRAVLEEAVQFSHLGGNFDLTATEEGPPEESAAAMLMDALVMGADLRRITISSDSYGSQPRFNERQECIGITYSRSAALQCEFRRLVREDKMDLAQALLPFTENVAERMGLARKKGRIATGCDADLILFNSDLCIDRVYAKGRQIVGEGKSLVKGMYA